MPTASENSISERLSGLSVLAVDDHAINRDFLRAALGRRVAQLVLAGSGFQALDCCRDHRFDLVLMDLHMPDMDGLSAWQKILDECGTDRAGRVIALTADSREEERERLRTAGFHGFLTKPVEIDTLLQCMARVAGGDDGFEADADDRESGRSLLLDQPRAVRASGSEQNAVRMQSALSLELAQRADELDELLTAGRFEQAADLLHQWKGGSGYAGASRLEEASELLEQSLRCELDSSPGTLYLNLIRTTEATRQALALAAGDGRNPPRAG